uniref:Uncharacterized protein n=1 Tax=viral metagenome TaxID=1070528 RepID=A0A6C0ICN2_9ZZZZ
MEVFVLILFVTCDDHYGHYTYVEDLKGVYGTFEEAKMEADKMVVENANTGWPYNGDKYHDFLRIIKMTLGDKKKEIVFDSSTFELDAPIYNEKH